MIVDCWHTHHAFPRFQPRAEHTFLRTARLGYAATSAGSYHALALAGYGRVAPWLAHQCPRHMLSYA